MKNTRIAVVGIGGVGGYVGGMLTRVFPHVTLCARGARGESIRTSGLVLHSDYRGESVTYPEKVVESADLIGEQDIIFICVKNYSLSEVCELLKDVVIKDTIVVPIMNGVDPGDVIRKALPGVMVSDSLIYTISFANQDYSISQKGDYTNIFVGTMNQDSMLQEKIRFVNEVLQYAGIDSQYADDIEAEIWKKYILNCAYNVETAYYNNTIGEIRQDPKKVEELEALVKEAYSVAKKKEVAVEPEYVDQVIHRLEKVLAPEGTSSLQRDVAAGKCAEEETFSGYIVREAKRLGISVPISEQMYEGLKKIQKENERNHYAK